MLARSSLFKSTTPHLTKLSSINQTQSRFASGGFTPADMPIIKTKWAATTKVYIIIIYILAHSTKNNAKLR